MPCAGPRPKSEKSFAPTENLSFLFLGQISLVQQFVEVFLEALDQPQPFLRGQGHNGGFQLFQAHAV